MKVLLVAPYKNSFLGSGLFPPIGLGYLAASLRKSDHEVSILDCIKNGINRKGYADYVKQNMPDMVGVNSWSSSINEVKEILDTTKSLNSMITTVVGGPHPSAVPLEAVSFFTSVDYGFKGEAEIGLPKLADLLTKKYYIEKENIPGLLWKDGEHWKENKQVCWEALDDFDYLAWDLIGPEEYIKAGTIVSGKTAPIITTRGCPYLCTFCSPHIISGRKVRYRSTYHIIQELKTLKSQHGITRIAIMDENFTFNRRHAVDLCRGIISENIALKFFLPNGIRLDTLDEEILVLMKNAGFLPSVAVGIESGSERVLKMIKKNLRKEIIREKILLMRKLGFRPIGYFILGFPSETKAEMYETLSFAKELKLYRAAFSPLMLLPGTEIYNSLKNGDGLPKGFEFSQLVTDNITYAPQGMSLREVSAIRKDIVLKFNLQPRVIHDYMRDFNSFSFALNKVISLFFRKERYDAAG